MKKELIEQHVIEDPETETVEETNQETEVTETEEKEEKTFTQADVDRIVADRVKREKETAFEAGQKHAKEQADKAQKAKEYESLNTKEKLERAEQELEAYRAKEAHQQMLVQAQSQVADAKMDYPVPDEVLEVLIKDEDSEATKKAVDQTIDVFKKMYEDIRTEFLKGKTPKVPRNSDQAVSFGAREAQSRNADSHKNAQIKSNWG